MKNYFLGISLLVLFACKEEAKRPIEDLIADSRIYLKVNKADSALILIEKALKQDESNINALDTKINILAQSKSNELERFVNELPKNYPNSNKQLLLACIQFQNGKLTEAKQLAQAALSTFNKLVDNGAQSRETKSIETNQALALSLLDSIRGKQAFEQLAKKYNNDFIMNKFHDMSQLEIANAVLLGE